MSRKRKKGCVVISLKHTDFEKLPFKNFAIWRNEIALGRARMKFVRGH